MAVQDNSGAGCETTVVGCYSLHLYCCYKSTDHEYREFPHEYTGATGGQCRRQARRDGWIINVKHNQATCPKCSGKRRRK
jgi:hypothetical protein